MKRALITGISGFVGSHLADYLLEQNIDVYGTIRWRSNLMNIGHIKRNITLHTADLVDLASLIGVMRMVQPDFVFHLAAQSFVPDSWTSPSKTMDTNVTGTVNVLESIRIADIDPRIHICGSSEEYGHVDQDEVPISEDQPLRPMSPYGVSKVATDLLGWQYFKSYGMKIVRTRAFNHTGPRRGEVFVISNFCKQIAMIEQGYQPKIIRVGNLEAQRDFTDVRDIVRAYWMALHSCEFGEVYNICSGRTWRIRAVLEDLLNRARKKIEIVEDPTRMRPSDVPVLLGSPTKFENKTGWIREVPFHVTLNDTLEYWRGRVAVDTSEATTKLNTTS